ncbi:MAG: ABC transporter substrate-binding protein [Phycisphaerales bacterium]
MLQSLGRLWLGLVLILAASATLVLTDRSGSGLGDALRAATARRIAVIQISSIDAMNAGRDGLLEFLADRGYTAEAGATIDLFNAEGDVGTLGQISAQVAGASPPYDLAVTLSTVATQSFLRANKRGVPQVFGLVTSPPAIGVPLGAWEPDSTRPPSVAGFGTLQPAELLFDAMLACAPQVRRIGTVWNPAEPNAEASVKLGREVCAKLGLELVEANGANVNEVVAAAEVVLSRGVDCFWILPDTNAIAAASPIIERCRRSKVPVVTNFPNMADLGAAINYGADYHGMGIATGTIADLVLSGVPPREIPVENFVPVTLWLNLGGFGEGWSAAPSVTAEAERIVGADGVVEVRETQRDFTPPGAAAVAAARPRGKPIAAGRIPEVAALTFGRTPNFEECHAGFVEELARLGYEDGRTIRLSLRDAQLDSGTLNTIVSAIESERPDVVVPFTTPALQATLRRVRNRPIVFSLVASGVAAGAGASATDHLPNVTGAETSIDAPRMREILKAVVPGVTRVGTVFAPSEANSLHHRDLLVKALEPAGIEVVAAPADRPTEIPEAADSLAARGVDLFVQISDNASASGFNSIVRSADRANLPVFAFTTAAMASGATLSVSLDYSMVGAVSARMLDRVLRGESPERIPFAPPQESILLANPARLEEFGIDLTPELAAIVRFTDESGQLPASEPAPGQAASP